MRGFFKRDLYLLLPNLKFYLVFVALMGAVSLLSQKGQAFLGTYLVILSSSLLISLFNSDEMNGWSGYAAAVPNGRRARVDGRYAAALVVGGGIIGVEALMLLLGRRVGELPVAALHAGGFLIYADVLIPLQYRFGGKGRLMLLLLAGVVVALTGVAGAQGVISLEAVDMTAPALVLLAAGAGGMAVSHRLSVMISMKSEG